MLDRFQTAEFMIYNHEGTYGPMYELQRMRESEGEREEKKTMERKTHAKCDESFQRFFSVLQTTFLCIEY